MTEIVIATTREPNLAEGALQLVTEIVQRQAVEISGPSSHTDSRPSHRAQGSDASSHLS